MPDESPPRWVEYMPLDDLKPAPRNPKLHDSGIGASIARFGVIELQVLDERTGRLVSGHGRLDAYKAARDAGEEPPDGVHVDDDGVWLVPVARGWRSRNKTEAEAALIAVNRLIEAGGWDKKLLHATLATVGGSADGFVGVGFAQSDLDKLGATLGHGNTGQGESIGEKADGYANSGVRSFVLDYPVAEYEPLSRLLVELRKARGVPTNNDLVALLVEDACLLDGLVFGDDIDLVAAGTVAP